MGRAPRAEHREPDTTWAPRFPWAGQRAAVSGPVGCRRPGRRCSPRPGRPGPLRRPGARAQRPREPRPSPVRGRPGRRRRPRAARGPLPADLARAGPGRRQDEIASLAVEPERAGHPVLRVQQFAEPFQGVRGHQQRPPGGRRHDGAEPHTEDVEGAQRSGAGHGGQAHRAGRTATGRQHDGGGGPVGPPPAHHALVRGGRQQVGIEGVCARYGAVGFGAGAAEAAALAARAGLRGPHSGEHGPLPYGGAGQGRVEPGGPLLAPEPEPASPSEDLAHERSFLSVERRVHMTPRVCDTTCVSLRCAYVLISSAVRACRRYRA